MLLKFCGLCAPLILLAFQATAGTVAVDYSLTNLGSGEYRYDYSITNNGSLGAGVPIQLFDIFFDPNLYQNLTIVTQPPLTSSWDAIILSAVGTSPALFDNLATGAGIPDGGTASGFAIQFLFTGSGAPGSQTFEISDPNTFAVLQTGTTVPATDNTVPEPATFGTVGLLLALGIRGVSRKKIVSVLAG